MRKFGRDPWRDIQILLRSNPSPICFDVGAHRGETVQSLVDHFLNAIIHAFEPEPDNFGILQEVTRNLARVKIYSLALGDLPHKSKLIKTHYSQTNSFLPVSAELKSEAHQRIGEVEVTVTTLDLFCEKNQIQTIDLLKTDCQGFDLRVLKGATKLLSEHRISVIQCESLFMPEYEGQGWFYEILQFLTGMGYVPVSFGEVTRNKNNEATWTDVIFKRRASTSP